METGAQANYRAVLQRELEARCGRNPQYSLRAFASHLGISASSLTEVLNGQHGMSQAKARQVASKLGLSMSEADWFCDSVESEHGRSPVRRQLAKARLARRQQDPFARTLADDVFQLISDWHHFAILELTYLRRFQAEPQWVAAALGISAITADQALDRLKRLKLLQKKGSKWVACEDFTSVASQDKPSAAIQAFHQKVLARAAQALAVKPVTEREYSSTIVAIRKDKVPEAKRLLKELRQRFCRTISDSDDRDSVYCLSQQFFELTEKSE